MNSYIPDNSGINSLGGFAYQIKVFVKYLVSLKKGMQISFEGLDDVSINNLTPDNIDENEDKFRNTLKKENEEIKAIQVKRTKISDSVAKKTLLNWMLLESSSYKVSDYILLTDNEYNNEDIVSNISSYDLFKEVEATTKNKQATIRKVKDMFDGDWCRFKEIYNSVNKKYNFISLTNLDNLIDEKCEILFKKAGVKQVTYYRRIKELLQHITFEIIESVNCKKSYTINFEDMVAISEDICNRFKDEMIIPQYSEFKKICKIDFNDLAISNSREYKQLVSCKLPQNLIEQHLKFLNYYRNTRYLYMDLNKIGMIKDIEETTYENFENVKFNLKINSKDTPYNRLDETKKMSNSHAINEQIKYGSSIHLTRDDEVMSQISWEDEENA